MSHLLPINIVKRYHGFILVAILILVTGCGRKNNSVQSYVTTLDTVIDKYEYCLLDTGCRENIVYYGVNYNQSRQEYIGQIMNYTPQNKKSQLIPIETKRKIQDLRVVNDTVNLMTQDIDGAYILEIHSFDGKLLDDYKLNIDDTVFGEAVFWDTDEHKNMIWVDRHSNLYIISQTGEIAKYKLQGELISAFVSSENIFYYVVIDEKGQEQIGYIDYLENKEDIITTTQEMLQDCMGIYECQDGILINENASLLRVDINKREIESIFEWIDIGIDNNELCLITENNEGYLIVTKKYRNNIEEIQIKRIEKGKVSDAKVLELATMYLDQELKEKVILFNETHSDMKIHVRTYPGETSDLKFKMMVNDLYNNSDIDLVVTDTNYYRLLADNGVLADLQEYYDDIQNQMITSVVDAYRYNEKVYVLMDQFEVYTILGRKQIFQQDRNYTYKELINIAEKWSGSVYNRNVKSDTLYDLLILNDDIESYSMMTEDDWNEIITFIDKAPLEESGYDKGALLEKVVIKQNYYLWFELFKAGHNDRYTIVGYPSIKEDVTGSMFDVPALYGINSRSKNKEDSWIFIRELMGEDIQKNINDDFPIRKETFEEKLLGGMNTVEEGKTVSYISGDTFIDATIEGISEDDINKIRWLVYQSDQIYYMNADYYNIIEEEVSAYYQKQKTIPEVISLFDSRLKLYFSENDM